MSKYILYKHKTKSMFTKDADWYRECLFERIKSDEFFGIVADGECVDYFLYIINDDYGVKYIHCTNVIHMYGKDYNNKSEVFTKYKQEYYGHIMYIREICSLIADTRSRSKESDEKLSYILLELLSLDENRIKNIDFRLFATLLVENKDITVDLIIRKIDIFRRILLSNISMIEYIERNKVDKVVENNKEYL